MDIQTIAPLGAFAACFFACWAVYHVLGNRKKRTDERLAILEKMELTPKEERPSEEVEKKKDDGSVQDLVKSAAPLFSKPLQPRDGVEENAIRLRLAHAGFNSPYAVQVYLALRFASLVAGAVIGMACGVAWWGPVKGGLSSAVVGAAIGLFLPEIVRRVIAKSRQERIFITLPDAIDLLIIAIEVGLGLDVALRRVANFMKNRAPDLVAEINLYLMQVEMGRQRRHALHDLGLRAGVDDLNAVAALLIQADRFGSSIADTLRQQSEAMRISRRQAAEEQAQQTAVKLIFPLVLFIFPGIFVVLVGPAAILLMQDMLGMK